LDVDLTGYTGQVGQKIRIRVTDDFAVKSVVVTIHNADGTLQEEGDAALEENQLDWIYTTNSNNISLTGDKITIIAADIPDNLTKQEKVM
jgi:dTDP-4-dehydrorhamnose reductase